ncbi:hypothetical protein tinsulaeT_04350 [Thalassotalea insulae]|uniref:EfeO-type cupredoxin-like domain-containing protein n=1 Tax=Thalassotalea insulae TaxID=2056778 RepID=A0ABQ6GRP1_9GAMM|nr:cupredoxin domain-containing protein [Thalassotalea insulae]GLX77095.1 hypothetical protein tinsulaeT_04350 [Thalassotalea insulae]
MRINISTLLLFAGLLLLNSIRLWAKEIPEFHLTLENHLFFPAEIEIPAGKKVKLIIFNKDAEAEEFDSFDLNREKVIFPGRKSTIYIGPLPPGDYEFFGEYNPNTATGKVIVKGDSDAD